MSSLILVLVSLDLAFARTWSGYEQPEVDRPAPVYSMDYSEDYYNSPAAKPALPYYSRTYEPSPYRAAYPSYYYEEPRYLDPEEERAAREAALPIGQEILYEGEESRFNRPVDVDTTFLQNLILAEMARDARKKQQQIQQREIRDEEDEDVRELKALAGKPLYHVAKTRPREDIRQPLPTNNYGASLSDDYVNDDSFINWNRKRSEVQQIKTSTTPAPPADKNSGQKEVVMPRPATPVRHPFPEQVMKFLITETAHPKGAHNSVQEQATNMIANQDHQQVKRFVTNQADLVKELRGLKHKITT